MTMHERHDRPTDALEQRLEAYAAARLQPDPGAMERVRAAVMTEARQRLVQVAAPAAVGAALSAPAPGGLAAAMSAPAPVGGLRQRWQAALRVRLARSGLAMAGAGLAVVLAGGAAYAASQPGGPLYGTRLWVEGLTLPAGGQARVDADEARLAERLADVETAARNGDAAALGDALRAYRDTLTDTLKAAGTDLSKQARLETLLARHLAVLEALVDRLPAGAADALAQELARTNATLQEVQQGGGPGNGGNGSQGGAPSTRPGQGPAATPRAQGGGPPASPPGQANQPSPKPTPPAASPATTAKPGHTPAPRPSPSPRP